MSKLDPVAVLIKAEEDGRAAYSLQEKLINEAAISQMKAELILTFSQTKLDEDDIRRDLWSKMQVIEWYNACLTDIINNGKFASDTLEHSKTNIKE